MEKLKEYKYLILILLIILGFSFYWFEWRPYRISKNCSNTPASMLQTGYFKSENNLTYDYFSCLHEAGVR